MGKQQQEVYKKTIKVFNSDFSAIRVHWMKRQTTWQNGTHSVQDPKAGIIPGFTSESLNSIRSNNQCKNQALFDQLTLISNEKDLMH